MSDDDPTLTPEQEREVRRLLADARHTEPVPGDVAARLDRVLAELAAGEPGPTPVSTLASRRRHRAVSVLVAAAAVVAVGIGLGQVVGTRGSEHDSSAGAAADRPEAGARSKSPTDELNGTMSGEAAQGSQNLKAPRYALESPAVVHPHRFSRDVMRLRERTGAAGVPADSAPSALTYGLAEDRLHQFSLDCPPADWGAGVFVPVLYAGDPGVLVFRRADGDTQVVDLFQCGDAEVVRSITLPAT